MRNVYSANLRYAINVPVVSLSMGLPVQVAKRRFQVVSSVIVVQIV